MFPPLEKGDQGGFLDDASSAVNYDIGVMTNRIANLVLPLALLLCLSGLTVLLWRHDVRHHLEMGLLESEAGRGADASMRPGSPGHIMFLAFGLTLSTGLSFLLYSLMRRMQMYRVARDQAIHEVTERKQAEKALREAEEKQKAILAAIPDIVVQIDRDRVRTWCKDGGYAFFGDGVIGKTEDYYVEGEKPASVPLQSLLDGRENMAYMENWQKRRDGQPRLLAWRYRRLVEDSGEVIGAICTARDMTDQRRLEQEREAMVRELSDKSAELESFVYTVSHDLKTPIVTVEGFVGALREDFQPLLGEDGERYLSRITDATDKMEGLINDLLDLSRIGRISETKAEMAFGVLAREAVKSLYPQIKARGVTVQIQDNMPTIFGEKKRLAQVMDNLIANAVKYIGEDNPEPRIEVGAENRGNETVFFVKDNGTGIDKAYFDKIFKVFQRLPAALRIDGTGIGLTIVKRIVELHGGRVWVESEVGKGSTFYFTVGRSGGDLRLQT